MRNLLTLMFLFSLLVSQAQLWKATVSYVDQDHLEVNVEPNYTYQKQYRISFPKGIIEYNRKSTFRAFNSISGEFEKLNPSFELNPQYTKFSYHVDLGDSANIALQAYLDYGPVQLANWAEILFESDKDIQLAISFQHSDKIYDVGSKDLKAWKLNPSPILPMKLVEVTNQVSCYSNLPNGSLTELLKETLQDFSYLKKPIDLVILFGDDSLDAAGTFFTDWAIVYIDSKTTGENPNFTIQQQVLKQLFRAVSPYNINPEEALRNINQNWLAEATPEYLSLKFMLRKGLLSADEFLNIMERKMVVAAGYAGISLDEMSSEIYRNSDYLEAFQSKGCIASWLLDLRLFELTDGQVASEDLIFGNFGALDEDMQLLVSDALFDMEKELVSNELAMPMNAYLNGFGLSCQQAEDLLVRDEDQGELMSGFKIVFDNSAVDEQKSRWKRFASE